MALTVKRKIWFLREEGGSRQSRRRIWEETFNLTFCCVLHKCCIFRSNFQLREDARGRSCEVIFTLPRHECLLLSCAVAVSILILICVCLASLPWHFFYCHNISFHLPHFSLSTFLHSRVRHHHSHHLAIDSHVNTTEPNNWGENRFVLWRKLESAGTWCIFFYKLWKTALFFFSSDVNIIFFFYILTEYLQHDLCRASFTLNLNFSMYQTTGIFILDYTIFLVRFHAKCGPISSFSWCSHLFNPISQSIHRLVLKMSENSKLSIPVSQSPWWNVLFHPIVQNPKRFSF